MGYNQTVSTLRTEISNLQNKLKGGNSDAFLSLEDKLRNTTDQLVVAKSRTVYLERQLEGKDFELSSLRAHYMNAGGTGNDDSIGVKILSLSSSNAKEEKEKED